MGDQREPARGPGDRPVLQQRANAEVPLIRRVAAIWLSASRLFLFRRGTDWALAIAGGGCRQEVDRNDLAPPAVITVAYLAPS